MAALSVWFLAFSLYDVNMPVWTMLTGGSGQMSVFTFLLGVFCGFWATRREHRNLRRLRKAVREGEYQEAVAQHEVWYAAMRWLPVVAAVLLLISFARLKNGRVDPAEYPFIAAEDLGGTPGEHDARVRNTLLCRTVILQEGHLADFRDRNDWWLYETQLELYRPRPGAFAKPLARELSGRYGMAQVDTPDSLDAAYYGRDGAVQYLLLRGGGTVLFYRTNAPEDLRAHVGEFAALLQAYR